MNRLTALLADRSPLLDGGYGWLLQERGLPAGDPAEGWNATNPDAIAALHTEYALAGATMLTTNTFGASRCRLAHADLDDQITRLNERGAAIARAVAERHGILVAGNIGPTGELLEPMGSLTPQSARDYFREQIGALADGGAHLLVIETMSDLCEARAAVEAAHEAAPALPIIATMSFDTNLRTMMGVDPARAVRELAEAGADGVGANCGRGPDEMSQIARQLVAARPEGILIVAQSNAGLPQLHGGDFVYTVDPEGMAAHAIELRDLGVDIIGACCGSAPAHIAAMGTALGEKRSPAVGA